jgi:hypothetical protein
MQQLTPEQINQLLESAKQLATLQEESQQDHTYTIQFLISQAQQFMQCLAAA